MRPPVVRPLAVIAALLSCAAAGTRSPASTGRHVALLSIDGLRPIDLGGEGPCGPAPPHLADLMRRGLRAEGMEGVLPSLTYPAHATMVTGVTPDRHGVLANARWRDGAAWHFDRSDIHAATLWDAARAAGRTVAIVTWPSTYGAAADALVPEDLSSDAGVRERLARGSTPDLFRDLEAATGEAALLPFNDPEAGVPLDRMTARFAAEIVRRQRPDLLLAHFLELDHREHDAGPGTEAACAALRRIDDRLGDLEEAYRDAGILDRTAFVVVSDHGFLPVHTLLNLPAILAEAGAGRLDPRTELFESDLVVRPAEGSAAVYPSGNATRSRLRTIEKDLRPRLERTRGTVLRWMSRKAADRLGGFAGAAFVLCAEPGYFFTDLPGDPRPLIPSEKRRGTHGYCPGTPGIDASFLAGGDGIPAAGVVPRVRMIDVAPTVAALLGLRLAGIDGKLMPWVADASRRPPVR